MTKEEYRDAIIERDQAIAKSMVKGIAWAVVVLGILLVIGWFRGC